MTDTAAQLKSFVKFTVIGKPQPKQRPKRGHNGTMYTPAATRAYESRVKRSCSAHMAEKGIKSMGKSALYAQIEVVIEPPESWSNAKRQDAVCGTIRPKAKPDLDNYIKAILDGCEGVAYDNDSQVVIMTANKRYGEEPHVKVFFEEID